MIERLADEAIRLVGWLLRGRCVKANRGARINLGSGPEHVAPGWINVDASIHALLAPLPMPVLREVFRRTDAGSDAAHVVKTQRFVFHDFRYGIPFEARIASAVYTSHMLEHLAPEVASRLIADAHRVLEDDGIIRIVVPSVPEWATDAHEMTARYLDRHRSRYTRARLQDMLEGAGFRSVTVQAYRTGKCPDIDILDNRPGSIFIEAVK